MTEQGQVWPEYAVLVGAVMTEVSLGYLVAVGAGCGRRVDYRVGKSRHLAP